MPFGILDCKKMEVVPGTGQTQHPTLYHAYAT